MLIIWLYDKKIQFNFTILKTLIITIQTFAFWIHGHKAQAA